MERLIFSMLALALQWFRPRYNAQLQFTAAQIRIPRSRIDATRIVPTPKEKAELLRIGESLGHDVAEVMHSQLLVPPGRKRIYQCRGHHHCLLSTVEVLRSLGRQSRKQASS